MSVEPIYLKGKYVHLRSLKPEDFGEAMVAFVNDREVTRHLVRGTFPGSTEEFKAEYARQAGNREEVQFALVESKTGRYLGVAGLHRIDWIARHAEFRILIGEKEAWGKGFGTEALQLLLAYGFEILNLNKVWLGVNLSNARAHQSYKKAGFVSEGTLRQEVYRNGRYHDCARMSLLRTEYQELKGKWEIAGLLQTQLPV